MLIWQGSLQKRIVGIGSEQGELYFFDNLPKVTLLRSISAPTNAEIRIARIFNTYGPRMNIDDGCVVSNFIAQAIRLGAFVTSLTWLMVLFGLWKETIQAQSTLEIQVNSPCLNLQRM
ncbi:hypothetical protein L6452_11651 [Arctium lappa]|uniref:Uncharacterized protein n=1 Tax=Arctium lappa TaxID=4217 RepID=A0ACB9DP99_ARCLA|nr:hypothetical protein L6452_11651 [Arctium lappa]